MASFGAAFRTRQPPSGIATLRRPQAHPTRSCPLTPDGSRIKRVFTAAKINFETIFGRADLSADVRTSILLRARSAERGWTTSLDSDANVPIIGLQDHRTIVGGRILNRRSGGMAFSDRDNEIGGLQAHHQTESSPLRQRILSIFARASICGRVRDGLAAIRINSRPALFARSERQ